MDNIFSSVRCIQFMLLRVCNTVYFHTSVYVVMPSFLPRPFTTALKHGYDGRAGSGSAVLSLAIRRSTHGCDLPVCFCIACLRLHGCLLGRSVSAPPAATDLEGLSRRCTVQSYCCGLQSCLFPVSYTHLTLPTIYSV